MWGATSQRFNPFKLLLRETGWWGLRGSSLFCMSLLIWLLHTAPWSCPIGQVIKPCLTRRNPNLSEGLQCKQEQVSDSSLTSSTWHSFALWERICSKLRSCAKGSPFCYQGRCTWLIGSTDCQRISWNCCVNWLTRHLSFSSTGASLQSLGLLLHSQPDSPSLAKSLLKRGNTSFLLGVHNESQTSPLLRGKRAHHREVKFVSFRWIIISPKTCTEGFMVSCSPNIYRRLLYVGDVVPCLCKQNSCYDLFLYCSIQVEPRKMPGGWLFVVVFCSYCWEVTFTYPRLLLACVFCSTNTTVYTQESTGSNICRKLF